MEAKKESVRIWNLKMEFKWFGVKIFWASVACVLMTLFAMVFILQDEEIAWGLRYYRYKNVYAQSLNSPKIIVAGGSSALFGIRAADLSATLKMPAVNLAINGGFSAYFLLQQLKRIVGPGDIVIFAPDFEVYGEGRPDVEWMSQYDYNVLRIEHPEDVKTVPVAKQVQYLFGVNLLNALSHTMIVGIKNFIHGVAQKPSELSVNGDFDTCTQTYTGNIGLTSPPVMTDRSSMYLWVKDFLRDVEKHGVKLFFAFAPRANHDQYKHPGWTTGVDDMVSFLKQRGIGVIGNPRDFIYPKEDFCNAFTHLNKAAAERNTAKIIGFLASEGIKSVEVPNGG